VTEPNRTSPRSPYWAVLIARAIPFILVGLAITFINFDQTAQTGLIAYGIFAIVSGIVVGGFSWLRMTERSPRLLFLIQGIVSVLLGIVALIFSDGGLGFFLLVASMNATISGFLELFSGLRTRSHPAARDWTVVGGLTIILALVMLFIPPGSNPVVAVGIFGAYAVIIGLFLVIAGLSLRWGTHTSPATRPGKTS
jgi:uncharacterized membrane protein HdeD (DUF308 family)